jgi:hypothetical protein
VKLGFLWTGFQSCLYYEKYYVKTTKVTSMKNFFLVVILSLISFLNGAMQISEKSLECRIDHDSHQRMLAMLKDVCAYMDRVDKRSQKQGQLVGKVAEYCNYYGLNEKTANPDFQDLQNILKAPCMNLLGQCLPERWLCDVSLSNAQHDDMKLLCSLLPDQHTVIDMKQFFLLLEARYHCKVAALNHDSLKSEKSVMDLNVVEDSLKLACLSFEQMRDRCLTTIQETAGKIKAIMVFGQGVHFNLNRLLPNFRCWGSRYCKEYVSALEGLEHLGGKEMCNIVVIRQNGQQESVNVEELCTLLIDWCQRELGYNEYCRMMTLMERLQLTPQAKESCFILSATDSI